MKYPKIIQGGMGIAVSDWKLARAVSRLGQLGVVSGTAIDSVLARRLQSGDPGGHMRRALDSFPVPDIARRVYERYFIEGGKDSSEPFMRLPNFTISPRPDLHELTVVASFVEVFLAKTGHNGPIGINLLQKVEMPTLPSLYGAMLAGVGFVLMGAGIPREIPGALDELASHDETSLKLQVSGEEKGDNFRLRFDPRAFLGDAAADLPTLERPKFLAIISSSTLATSLMRRATGKIDGFVIERPTAGGHNASPRGRGELSSNGEPVYGPRDEVNFEKIAAHGLPFWLAGAQARPEGLQAALDLGAAGVQVGTSFALCQESGLDETVKGQLLDGVQAGDLNVFTDPVASPTGFPFKVVEGLPETLAEAGPYEKRERVCDLGYLRTAFRKEGGSLGYRCAAEPADDWVRKGGAEEDATGRKCLCNALLANVGLPQPRGESEIELPLITCGDDLIVGARRLIDRWGPSYTAGDVIADLLGQEPPSPGLPRDSEPSRPTRAPGSPTTA